MIDKLLAILAPHLCYKCGKTGHLLCDNCKYDITSEEFNVCILCGKLADTTGVCPTCHPFFTQAWCVGERADELRLLINDYKFMRVYAAHHTLGELLTARIGQLPSHVVIVPVPTTFSHIRQRGYDHTMLVARSLAKLQGVSMAPLLKRTTQTIQTGKTKKERATQAEKAFSTVADCKDKTILLLDDIVTTGATLQAGANALKKAGAADVWVAAIARQPLD